MDVAKSGRTAARFCDYPMSRGQQFWVPHLIRLPTSFIPTLSESKLLSISHGQSRHLVRSVDFRKRPLCCRPHRPWWNLSIYQQAYPDLTSKTRKRYPDFGISPLLGICFESFSALLSAAQDQRSPWKSVHESMHLGNRGLVQVRRGKLKYSALA